MILNLSFVVLLLRYVHLLHNRRLDEGLHEYYKAPQFDTFLRVLDHLGAKR